MAASFVQWPVDGSQLSGTRTPLASICDDLSVPPPVARTVPSGMFVRFRKLRGKAMELVACQVGLAWFISSVYAVFTDWPLNPPSEAEPALRNFPGASFAERPPLSSL